MKFRSAIGIYWILLLAPTLAAGWWSLRVLRDEDVRLEAARREAGRERARLLAERLQVAVDAVEREWSAALEALAPDERAGVLERWLREEPLVRNVFIWQEDDGLLLPPAARPRTREERGFVLRYDALFSGRESFAAPGSAVEARPPPAAQEDASMQSLTLMKGRAARAQREDRPAVETGWIPWFSGRALYLLGWARVPGERAVYGLELEMPALLSRLLAWFPPPAAEAGTLALRDGEGRILHQAGLRDLEAAPGPDAAVPLSPALPHWDVAWYGPAGAAAGAARRGFRLVSGLLVLTCAAAILCGGGLLLWQARRNALEALRKTTFVANVSHELKTPLTTVRMYAELLGEDRVRDPAKRARYLQVIIGESERLTRLVNNVLDFSRLEQHRKQYRPEVLELTAFLRDFADRHGPRIAEAGLALRMVLPETARSVTIDRDALEQTLLNLADNAVKYAAAGGELLIELTARDGAVDLDVMDRGPGVPPSLRESIFEKFFRADDSLTSRVPGSGLGLSIARRMIRDLGGELAYAPRPGGGAIFRLRLPGAQQGAKA